MKLTTTAKLAVIAAAAGGAAVYLSDPERGQARRERLAERGAELQATLRREVVPSEPAPGGASANGASSSTTSSTSS